MNSKPDPNPVRPDADRLRPPRAPAGDGADRLPSDVRAKAEPSRRGFLRGGVEKAAYIAPVVLSLSASRARAASRFESLCGDNGSPCVINADCCPGLTCQTGMCAP